MTVACRPRSCRRRPPPVRRRRRRFVRPRRRRRRHLSPFCLPPSFHLPPFARRRRFAAVICRRRHLPPPFSGPGQAIRRPGPGQPVPSAFRLSGQACPGTDQRPDALSDAALSDLSDQTFRLCQLTLSSTPAVNQLSPASQLLSAAATLAAACCPTNNQPACQPTVTNQPTNLPTLTLSTIPYPTNQPRLSPPSYSTRAAADAAPARTPAARAADARRHRPPDPHPHPPTRPPAAPAPFVGCQLSYDQTTDRPAS